MLKRHSKPLTLILLACLALGAHCSAWAQQEGNGLEKENPRRLSVLVEGLNEDDRAMGLSEELLYTCVAERLRSHGIMLERTLTDEAYLYGPAHMRLCWLIPKRSPNRP